MKLQDNSIIFFLAVLKGDNMVNKENLFDESGNRIFTVEETEKILGIKIFEREKEAFQKLYPRLPKDKIKDSIIFPVVARDKQGDFLTIDFFKDKFKNLFLENEETFLWWEDRGIFSVNRDTCEIGWVIMARNILPESKGKTFSEQHKCLKHGQRRERAVFYIWGLILAARAGIKILEREYAVTTSSADDCYIMIGYCGNIIRIELFEESVIGLPNIGLLPMRV